MFTGIIEAAGTVVQLEGGRLLLSPTWSQGMTDKDPIRIGESIAIDGCCLTVISESSGVLAFDLSPETLAKTTLGGLKPGSIVNLERAMRADGRFGGHIVQGHVEGTAEVLSVRPEGNAMVIGIRLPPGFERYVIDKGSITLSGVSLTVVNLRGSEFEVWLIPQTMAETNIGQLVAGSDVNLEVDVLAKYVERQLAASQLL